MPVPPSRLHDIVGALGRSRIGIVGDIMLDEYLHGTVERISPEAPVPVVDIASSRLLLGGAANVAANVAALGDDPVLIGVVGEDDAANRLRMLLDDYGIAPESLVVEEGRRTTIKTRIMAHAQQVVRADREDRTAIRDVTATGIVQRFEATLDLLGGVIISDYGKGVITPTLLTALIARARERNLFVAVDPKDANFMNYRDVSLITPNHHEAGFAFGRRIRSEHDLLAVGHGLRERLNTEALLITRGPDGMSLFQQGEQPVHVPTFARRVYDVTGAGDTVIAAFASARAAGASNIEAAIIANAAAGYTVGEVGTAAVTGDDLAAELERTIADGAIGTVVKDSQS